MTPPSAADLHSRGVHQINAGRLTRAAALLERAARAAEDVDLRARIAASLAYVEAETGDRATALDRCTAALRSTGISQATAGALHGQRGLLRMLTGDLVGALADLDDAIRSPAGPDVVGRGLLNRGDLLLQQDAPARAALDLEAAIEPLTRADRPVEAAMARHNLGYARFQRGDLPQALLDMDRARSVLAPLSAVNEATCDQDRAEVLTAAGLTRQGRGALASAARAYGSRRLRRRQGEAELVLARTLLLDDPPAARRTARAAARHFRVADAETWALRADAVVLAAEVELGGRAPSLVARADDLADRLRAQGLDWAGAALGLHAVRVLLRRDDVEAARARLAGLRLGRSAPMEVRLLGYEVRADVAAARGRRADALGLLRTGLGLVHDWQSGFGSLDLQTLVAGRGRRLGVRGLGMAVADPRDAVLLEWSERARMLASRVRPVRPPRDPALGADLGELRGIVAAHETHAAGLDAVAREDELRRRVREQAWQARGSGRVDAPCSLAELQAGLAAADPTALVAYVVAAGRCTALVVTADGCRRHDLGPRARLDALLGGLAPDLDMAAATLPGALAGAVRAELVDRLGRLDDLLVAPLREALGGRRVVLTPSGVLAGVPWTLLPTLAGRPVLVAQSATSWLARAATPLRLARVGLVAGPGVPRAGAEIEAAAGRWPAARCLAAEEATADAVSALAAGVDVLHVAAHGRHSAENPMFSGLQLADGPWFGYDVDRLPRVPDVVLLSACEVGRSSVRAGEELIGMTSAWLHAGARCVVAAPAAVNDEVAYTVLGRVHARLAAGDAPPTAVAAAVEPAGADAPPAPFLCFG